MVQPPWIRGWQLAEKDPRRDSMRPGVVFIQEGLHPANVPFRGVQPGQLQGHQYGVWGSIVVLRLGAQL